MAKLYIWRKNELRHVKADKICDKVINLQCCNARIKFFTACCSGPGSDRTPLRLNKVKSLLDRLVRGSEFCVKQTQLHNMTMPTALCYRFNFSCWMFVSHVASIQERLICEHQWKHRRMLIGKHWPRCLLDDCLYYSLTI